MAVIDSIVDLTERIFSGLRELKTPSLMLNILAFNLALAVIIAPIRNDFIYTIHANFLPFDSLNEELLVVLFLAPLIETVLYQYAIIDVSLYLLKLIFKKELIIVSIILSAISYSLIHLYDYVYMIQMVIAGFSYSIFYVVVKQKNRNALLYSLVLHILCNILMFGLKHI